MESILGYLELSASKRISERAKKLIESTDKIGLSYMGGANPENAVAEYKQARGSLVKELRK